MENKLKLLLKKELNESLFEKTKEEIEIFVINTAKEFVELGRTLDKPKPLFGNLIKKGQLVVFFGDNGTNKSTLMVQICDGISKGVPQLGLECSKGKVMLLDGEMATQPFASRYSQSNFDDNFIRLELNFSAFLQSQVSMDKLIFEKLVILVKRHQPDLLVIDNLTYLSSGSKEQSKEIIDLLRSVFFITKMYNTAVVLIGHVPKLEPNKPLMKEHLSGSKVLSDLADVVIGISTSVKSKKLRYIKELKNRNNEIFFDKDNVLVCEVSDSEGYLHLNYLCTSAEKEHYIEKKDTEMTYESILELKNEGLSNVKIAQKFGVNDKTIGNIIRRNSEKKL